MTHPIPSHRWTVLSFWVLTLLWGNSKSIIYLQGVTHIFGVWDRTEVANSDSGFPRTLTATSRRWPGPCGAGGVTPQTPPAWSRGRRATPVRVCSMRAPSGSGAHGSDGRFTWLPPDCKNVVPILGVKVKRAHFSWILEALAILKSQTGHSGRGQKVLPTKGDPWLPAILARGCLRQLQFDLCKKI